MQFQINTCIWNLLLVLRDKISFFPEDINDETAEEGAREEPTVRPEDEATENFVNIITAMKSKEVHKLRSNDTLWQYKLLCELSYPCIVGKHQWKINHSRVGIKTLTTVGDEPLIALILENNIKEWLHVARGGEVDNKKRLTLYMHGGLNGSGTRKGWSLEGRQRYNTIYGEVKAIRNSAGTTRLDEELKELWLKEAKEGEGTAQNSGDEGEVDEVEERTFEPAFDFDN